MWSGPRNISTAMMRSWGNRPDTFVCDEPFYAYYLQATGLPHPLAREIIDAGQTDWRHVTAWLTGPIPEGRPIFYQKHMTHHLLPEVERDWLRAVSNCFLIRDPREVMTSYIKKNDIPTLTDLGFVQQLEIFRWVKSHTSQPCPVLDAKDVLDNPPRMLALLCESLGVDFRVAMLAWPPGLRATDGLWAKHWYPEVETSTSFRPHTPRSEPIPESLREIHDQCRACYDELYSLRLH